jgi:DNA-binding HxlR family transcriptional regulator
MDSPTSTAHGPVEVAPVTPPVDRYQRADQLICKRWVVMILRALLDGPRRFSEIGAGIGLLSDRTLSARLSEMERQGIVERRVVGDKPVRVEYALTTKGYALGPVVSALDRWADAWLHIYP